MTRVISGIVLDTHGQRQRRILNRGLSPGSNASIVTVFALNDRASRRAVSTCRSNKSPALAISYRSTWRWTCRTLHYRPRRARIRGTATWPTSMADVWGFLSYPTTTACTSEGECRPATSALLRTVLSKFTRRDGDTEQRFEPIYPYLLGPITVPSAPASVPRRSPTPPFPVVTKAFIVTTSLGHSTRLRFGRIIRFTDRFNRYTDIPKSNQNLIRSHHIVDATINRLKGARASAPPGQPARATICVPRFRCRL